MSENLKQHQLSRINLYALTSRLTMQEVDKGLLESIENDKNILAFFPTYEKWQKRKKYKNKEDLIQRELNVDFTNLFLLHLIPYESFYIREDQMMETGGDNPVMQFFNDFDYRVELDKARVMSADHIGVELEFMYKLCEAEYKALENEDFEGAGEIAKVQYQFMKEHIIEWMPMYLINVKSEAGTAFYFDLADLTLEFILSDFEYLSELKNNGYKYQQ